MLKYRGYLAPYAPFIAHEVAKGTPTFRIAKMLYARGIGVQSDYGSEEPRRRIVALNILIRYMLGRKETQRAILDKRIAEAKKKSAALRKRLRMLNAKRKAA
jgi:hypothetical protein